MGSPTMHGQADLVDLAVPPLSTNYKELFPYIQLSSSPPIESHSKPWFFIEVPETTRNSSEYQSLLKMKVSGQRSDMEKAAADYLSSDAFITVMNTLPETLKKWPRLYHLINNIERESPDDIRQILTETFPDWEKASQTATGFLDRLWLSVFALVINVDFDLNLLERFIGVLKLVNLLQKVNSFATDSRVPHEKLSHWLHATVMLPSDIFPLPCPDQADPAKAYAIGQLNMVKYRFSGYQLGEICRIENVLKGEVREVTRHNRSKEQSEHEEHFDTRHVQKTGQHLTSHNLLEEVKKTLQEKTTDTSITDYKTDYQPASPQATTSGQWLVKENPAGGFEKGRSNFAKDIVERTAQRMTTKTFHQRSGMSVSETETTELSRFDNTGGKENIRGVYRWLNTCYSLYQGKAKGRFLIEITLPQPVIPLVDGDHDVADIIHTLNTPPASPKVSGIDTFETISPKPGEHYYLDLYQQYEVIEPTPPPPENKRVSATNTSLQPVCSTILAIPEGYSASTLKISVVNIPANTNDSIQVVLGATCLDYKVNASGGKGQYMEVTLSDLDDATLVSQDSLPVSVVCSTKTAQEDTPYPPEFLVNVELETTCSGELLAQWQYDVYQKLVSGYQKQKSVWQEKVRAYLQVLKNSNPQKVLDRINSQLVKHSISQLYQHAIDRLSAPDGQVSRQPDELLYFQYFENSLEWSDLYCQLYHDDQSKVATEDQSLFMKELDRAAFVWQFYRANQAKILVPVKPELAAGFMFFLDNGLIWQGNPSLAPVNESSKNWSAALKTVQPTEPVVFEQRWEVTLPTTMTVLAESDYIPDLDDDRR